MTEEKLQEFFRSLEKSNAKWVKVGLSIYAADFDGDEISLKKIENIDSNIVETEIYLTINGIVYPPFKKSNIRFQYIYSFYDGLTLRENNV